MEKDKTKSVAQRIDDFINSLSEIDIKNSPFISFVTEIDDINLYSVLKYFQKRTDIFYYSVPQRNFYIAASGEVFSLEFNSVNQLNKYSGKFDEIKNSICNNFSSYKIDPPLFFLSAKFPSEKDSGEWKDFKRTKLFTPEFTFIKSDLKIFLVINHKTGSTADKKLISGELYKSFINLQQIPKNFQHNGLNAALTIPASIENDYWVKNIHNLLNRIQKNEIDKVVISRCKVFKIEGGIEPDGIAFVLDQKYPECYNFVYSVGTSVFFSASPEKLFVLNTGEIQTEALAGSIERGGTIDEDKDFVTIIKLLNRYTFEEETLGKDIKQSESLIL